MRVSGFSQHANSAKKKGERERARARASEQGKKREGRRIEYYSLRPLPPSTHN